MRLYRGKPRVQLYLPHCPVEEQIDAVLALLEQTEELDEEGMLRLYEQALAANGHSSVWSGKSRRRSTQTRSTCF